MEDPEPATSSTTEAPTVLVVDDEEPIRRILHRLLVRQGYDCVTASDVREARAVLGERAFDVVLTDMTMPGGSGLDLIMHVAENYPDTASIMVTGVDDTKLAESALELGCYGYIIKPFEANEVLINLSNARRRLALEKEQRNLLKRLETMVKERTAELWGAISRLELAEKDLRMSQEETVYRLSVAAEFRDNETARHIQRMSRYCGLLATRMGLDGEECELIRVASVMHDVGKIGIPDNILLKPGALTAEERLAMQEHAQIGYRILAGSESPVIQCAATIALTHHEKVDGSGYPKGLKSDEIPAPGRMAAIADVFDALISDRVYKKSFPLGKAVGIMQEGKGIHFDPDMLEVFLDSMSEVLRIREEFGDWSV
jgi:putative two-component system response regulator